MKKILIILSVLFLVALSYYFLFNKEEKNNISKPVVLKEGEILKAEEIKANLPATVKYNEEISVSIPENLVKTNERLTIKTVPEIPVRAIDGTKVISAYDISIGDLHNFDKEIIIEVKYDPKDLSDEDALAGKVLASYWDPEKNAWIDLPVSVDVLNHKITYKTKHLSISILEWIMWDIYTTSNFKILYSKKAINSDLEINNKVWQERTKKTNYVEEGTPYYIKDLGSYLEEAWLKYILADFEMPKSEYHMVVKVDSVVSEVFGATAYDKVNERIHVNTSQAFKPGTLKLATAHEIFHAIQNQYFNMAQMSLRKWWIEATAEYTGWMIVWEGKSDLPPRINSYLQKSITDGDNEHAYATAYFIDHLVKNGANFKEMWDYVASANYSDLADVLSPLKRYLGDLNISLSKQYNIFAQSFVFNENGIILSNNNPLMPAGIVDIRHTRMADDSTDKSIRLKIPKDHTSFILEIKAKQKTEAEKIRNIEVWIDKVKDLPTEFEGQIYFSKDGSRSGSVMISELDRANGKIGPVVLDLTEDSAAYLIMTNGSGDEIPVSLEIREKEPKVVDCGGNYEVSVKDVPSMESFACNLSKEDKQSLTICFSIKNGIVKNSGNTCYSRLQSVDGLVDKNGNFEIDFKWGGYVASSLDDGQGEIGEIVSGKISGQFTGGNCTTSGSVNGGYHAWAKSTMHCSSGYDVKENFSSTAKIK